ncbi:MAG TPA: hypothetical protein PLB14_07640 [Smithellaceae bacterium]|jgi:hypothetical protein|nr:hypothetical protein [Syntrophaceae bacterium]HPL97861.1 hypothetical protein [Smithellaceae bacterium]HPV49564.1 hypothetical protein [Smithellaceae bacterium]
MTVEEQTQKLIQTGYGETLKNIRYGAVMAAAGLVLAGTFTGNPVFYGIAAAAAVVSFALWKITPHINNAARGLKEGMRQEGAVEISVVQWKDAEANLHEAYRGLILVDQRPVWRMEFAAPDGWQPAAGVYPAQLVFLIGVAWPVAVVTSDGILYPCARPKRAQASAC